MVDYIEIGGESRPVCYNNLALEEYQELTGISVFELGDSLTRDVKNVTTLAFVGLKHGFLEVCDYKLEYKITRNDVGRWLNVRTSGQMFSEFKKAMPQARENDKHEGDAEEKKLVGETSEG